MGNINFSALNSNTSPITKFRKTYKSKFFTEGLDKSTAKSNWNAFKTGTGEKDILNIGLGEGHSAADVQNYKDAVKARQSGIDNLKSMGWGLAGEAVSAGSDYIGNWMDSKYNKGKYSDIKTAINGGYSADPLTDAVFGSFGMKNNLSKVINNYTIDEQNNYKDVLDNSIGSSLIDTNQFGAFHAKNGFQKFSRGVGNIMGIHTGLGTGAKNLGEDNLGFARSALKGAGEGAKYGAGWGALAGLIVGGLTGTFKQFRTDKMRREAEKEAIAQNQYNLNAYDTMLNNIDKDMYKNQATKSLVGAYGGNLVFANGGNLHSNGSDWSNGITKFNNGGMHEENPYGGIQQGVAPDGQPNLVEEGEVKWNDYIFSKRLILDKQTADAYNLKQYTGKDFATIAEKIGTESEERPNDPISERGRDVILERLRTAQEDIKMQKNPQEYAEQQMQGMEQQQMQDAMMQEQMQQDPNMMQQQMSPEEQAMMEQQAAQEQGIPLEGQMDPVMMESLGMRAFGGPIFANGGYTPNMNNIRINNDVRTYAPRLFVNGGNTGNPKVTYTDVYKDPKYNRSSADSAYYYGRAPEDGGGSGNSIYGIILHHTGVSTTKDLFQGTTSIGAHILIKKDGSVKVYAPWKAMTRHSGYSLFGTTNLAKGNYVSIGVEFEGKDSQRGGDDDEEITDAQVASFITQMAPVIKEHRIPIQMIVSHYGAGQYAKDFGSGVMTSDGRSNYSAGATRSGKIDLNPKAKEKIKAALQSQVYDPILKSDPTFFDSKIAEIEQNFGMNINEFDRQQKEYDNVYYFADQKKKKEEAAKKKQEQEKKQETPKVVVKKEEPKKVTNPFDKISENDIIEALTLEGVTGEKDALAKLVGLKNKDITYVKKLASSSKHNMSFNDMQKIANDNVAIINGDYSEEKAKSLAQQMDDAIQSGNTESIVAAQKALQDFQTNEYTRNELAKKLKEKSEVYADYLATIKEYTDNNKDYLSLRRSEEALSKLYSKIKNLDYEVSTPENLKERKINTITNGFITGETSSSFYKAVTGKDVDRNLFYKKIDYDRQKWLDADRKFIEGYTTAEEYKKATEKNPSQELLNKREEYSKTKKYIDSEGNIISNADDDFSAPEIIDDPYLHTYNETIYSKNKRGKIKTKKGKSIVDRVEKRTDIELPFGAPSFFDTDFYYHSKNNPENLLGQTFTDDEGNQYTYLQEPDGTVAELKKSPDGEMLSYIPATEEGSYATKTGKINVKNILGELAMQEKPDNTPSKEDIVITNPDGTETIVENPDKVDEELRIAAEESKKYQENENAKTITSSTENVTPTEPVTSTTEVTTPEVAAVENTNTEKATVSSENPTISLSDLHKPRTKNIFYTTDEYGRQVPTEVDENNIKSYIESSGKEWEASDPKTEEDGTVTYTWKIKEPKNEKDLKHTWMRYSPIIGNVLGAGLASLKPDYANADMISNSYKPISPEGLGNYMEYNPINTQMLINSDVNPASAMAMQTARENAGGNSGTAQAYLSSILMNRQKAVNELATKMVEQNNNMKTKVAEFNRSTDSSNISNNLTADQANQTNRINTAVQAAAIRDRVDAARATAISTALTQGYNNMGALGQENAAINLVNTNPAFLGYGIGTNFQNIYNPVGPSYKAAQNQANTNALGGYLTINKKKKRR